MREVYFKAGDMSGILMLGPDGGPYQIYVDGRCFWFEFSEMWGPLAVNKNGREVGEPGPNHNFWKAVSLWANQGKRFDDDGVCKFERKPPMVCRKISGREFEVVSGEDCDIWPQPIIWLDA